MFPNSGMRPSAREICAAWPQHHLMEIIETTNGIGAHLQGDGERALAHFDALGRRAGARGSALHAGWADYASAQTLLALDRPHEAWERLTALREDVGEGVFFSIGSSATTVYNDIDKVMLSKLSDFASTGIYGAAYRIIDVSMSPVRSLVGAAYPEFFRRGVNGMNATYRYARSLISKSIIFGAVTFFGLWLCAPVLPHILGHQYEAAIPALRWLALIPFLRCIHVFLGDALSGAGFQRTRTGIQVFIALVNDEAAAA